VQRKELVEIGKLNEVMQLVFEIGEVQFLEASYDVDRENINIKDYQGYLSYIEERIDKQEKYISFALHYKESAGFICEERKVLDVKFSKGKVFGYKSTGWGIIYIQVRFIEENIECRISVNTEKRALKSESILSHKFKSPNLWNWKVVESKTRKLIRKLRS